MTLHRVLSPWPPSPVAGREGFSVPEGGRNEKAKEGKKPIEREPRRIAVELIEKRALSHRLPLSPMKKHKTGAARPPEGPADVLLRRACGRRPLPLAGAFIHLQREEREGEEPSTTTAKKEKKNRCRSPFLSRPRSLLLPCSAFRSLQRGADVALCSSPVEREQKSRKNKRAARPFLSISIKLTTSTTIAFHPRPREKKTFSSLSFSPNPIPRRQPSWDPPTPPTQAASSSS